MNDWLPNHTEHKPTASTVTMFQLTISFHKEKKKHWILSIYTVFSVHATLVYWPHQKPANTVLIKQFYFYICCTRACLQNGVALIHFIFTNVYICLLLRIEYQSG